MKTIRNFTFSLLFTLLLLELGLGIYARVANVKVNLPTYSFENTQTFWFDLNEDFGTWHLPNHHYRQKKTCFDTDYFSNSNGFRDFERSKESDKKRVAVIGDSFMEGYGVDTSMRASNHLEKWTKSPHLNFGLAGNFSPTQYWLLYEKMAIKFQHDAVIIGFLPSNDIIDDDISIIKKHGTNRYKPFLNGTYPNYTIEYLLDDLNKSAANPNRMNSTKKLLANFTHSYHFYLFLKAKWQNESSIQEASNQSIIPDYYNFSAEQFNRLKYSIAQIKKLAKNKPVLLLSIPNKIEINQFQSSNKNPLGDSLSLFCKQINVEYLDLLKPFSNVSEETLEGLFYNCDGHWSEKGNEFAAQQIKSHFSFYKP